MTIPTCKNWAANSVCAVLMVDIEGAWFCPRCDTAPCRSCEGTNGHRRIARPHAPHCRMVVMDGVPEALGGGWTPTITSPHGTPSRYESGCRCQPCGDANNARWRAYYTARKRAAAPAGPRSNQRWTPDEDQAMDA